MTFENGPVEVDETKPIWRYVGLPALLVYLEGNLRLQSVESLQRIDPAEGIPLWDDVTQTLAFEKEESNELWSYIYSTLSPNEQALWKANASSGHHIANQRIVFNEWREVVNRTRYAICFIESPHESMAMWRLFAPHGFSIRSSVQHLKNALKSSMRDWRVGRMRYWDRSIEITPNHAYANKQLQRVLRHPYFLKSLEYSQENEVRLVTVDPDGGSTLLVNHVDPFDWIMEIRISPEVWAEDAKLLLTLIEQRCPRLKERISISSVPVGRNKEEDDKLWRDITADLRQEEAAKWPKWLWAP